jgi:hypothetical protein
MTVYYSLRDAIDCPMSCDAPFIIAHERKNLAGTIGRYYKVFESFDSFLAARSNNEYPNTHEIMCIHKNMDNESNNWFRGHGRLVFDFDIDVKYNDIDYVPANFTESVESIIIDIIHKYYIDINVLKLKFVWSKCINPKKFSSHLTVKHACFDNWMKMMTIFYKLMTYEWDCNPNNSWITGTNLFDHQIIRNNGTLRMVGCSKIGGKKLKLINPDHKFRESLIKIYDKIRYDREQKVTNDSHHWELILKVLCDNTDFKLSTHLGIADNPKAIIGAVPSNFKSITAEYFKKSTTNSESTDRCYKLKIYILAFELVQKLKPNVFKFGKIVNKYLSLIRLKADECFSSPRVHEHQNAYLSIELNVIDETNGDVETYSIIFGCFRQCGNSVQLGTISKLDGEYVVVEQQQENHSARSIYEKNIILLELN